MPSSCLAGDAMTSIPLHLSGSLAVVADDLHRMRSLLAMLGNADGEYIHHVIQTMLAEPSSQLRPAVALLTAQMAVGEVSVRVLQFAAVVHMVHTAAKSHHQTSDRQAQTEGDPPQGPANFTLLAGDYLYAQAAYLTAGLHDLDVMSLLASTIQRLCRAELAGPPFPNGTSDMTGLFQLSAVGSARLVGCGQRALDICGRYGALLDACFSGQRRLGEAAGTTEPDELAWAMQHAFPPSRALSALIDLLTHVAPAHCE